MKKFKNELTFQKYLHGRTDRHGRNKDIPDVVIVNNILFTQDEYDIPGKIITYGNVKHQKTLYINTDNRYSKSGFTDAKVTIEDFLFARNDFPYLE